MLVSCGPTQHFVVSSPQAVQNENKEFYIENDSVKITYSFRGWRVPLFISVNNKLGQPVQIDWSRSAFILNNRPVSYHTREFLITGDVRVDSSSRTYNGQVKGRVTADEAMQFLPPNTSIARNFPVLPSETWSYDKFIKAERVSEKKERGKIFKYKKLAFSAAASPLVFRSYLTLIYPEGKEMHLDHHFYVSEVWQTWSGSGFANSGYAQNGNIFSL